MNLEEYNKSTYFGYKWLVKNLKMITVPDGLFLSSLGARICYSPKNPLALLRDEKVRDPDKRFNFLQKLFNLGHFSVFAHSPAFFDKNFRPFLIEDYISLIKLFKGWDYGQSFCFNVRHLVEAFKREGLGFNSLIANIYNGVYRINSCYCFFQDSGLTRYHLDDLFELGMELREPSVICFVVRYNAWEWFSFVVHGCSRVFTHQLVRHTWLNFSQRSSRHTTIEDVVVPKSIKRTCPPSPGSLERVYRFYVDDILGKYKTLLLIDIPKEDARFIAPEGSATTIMASGPRFVWEDFVEKRLSKKAQWEIRDFAEVVKSVLDEVEDT